MIATQKDRSCFAEYVWHYCQLSLTSSKIFKKLQQIDKYVRSEFYNKTF